MLQTRLPGKVRFARSLRKRLTEEEAILWQKLRNRQFFGYKFRRQHPLGTWIADFVCLERKIVIEIDGGYHRFRKKQDAFRDGRMEQEDFMILRFSNDQVRTKIDYVLQIIKIALEAERSPQRGKAPVDY